MWTESRRHGLQLLKEHPYIHAILLDIDCLMGSSKSFTELIQTVTQPFYCPKIVCTGEQDNFEHARTAMQNGAIDYLGIPLEKDELMACIERAVYATENERLSVRYLQKIDQTVMQLRGLVTDIEQKSWVREEPLNAIEAHEPQVHGSEYAMPTHPNPYMEKALSLTRLQTRKNEFTDLPELMSKAWSILLEIFTTEMSGRAAYVTTVAVGSAVAVSSTNRHLDLLQQRDLIVRHRDASDKRRIRVQLTDKARDQITQYFDQI
jgi:DNA-binding MarR family transcriptional regulator/DNA-binding NarL/FixJ family response regulator